MQERALESVKVQLSQSKDSAARLQEEVAAKFRLDAEGGQRHA